MQKSIKPIPHNNPTSTQDPGRWKHVKFGQMGNQLGWMEIEYT